MSRALVRMWIWVGFDYRSLLQKSPIKETLFCKERALCGYVEGSWAGVNSFNLFVVRPHFEMRPHNKQNKNHSYPQKGPRCIRTIVYSRLLQLLGLLLQKRPNCVGLLSKGALFWYDPLFVVRLQFEITLWHLRLNATPPPPPPHDRRRNGGGEMVTHTTESPPSTN